ncbi:TPA: hypothetical protein ACH3X3_002504 [Trebouxia sp. C0006]
MLRHYRQADQPRVPAPAKVTPNSIVLLLMLFKVIKSIEGITGLPAGTKLLLAANCLPFLKPDGFALPTFGLSPFMVWEHRQFYRLLTAGFLHADFNHMVLSSWVDCRWFGVWRQYFLEGAVGASGLCFAMQVVADHMRGGTVSVFGISGLEAPAKFSCWISLAVTQFLVPQASFTGHLCGVLAGLVHVYIPKAGLLLLFKKSDGDWQGKTVTSWCALGGLQQVDWL